MLLESTTSYLFDHSDETIENLQLNYGYPSYNTQVVRCPYCGDILKYNSINYHEGYHIDGCDEFDFD